MLTVLYVTREMLLDEEGVVWKVGGVNFTLIKKFRQSYHLKEEQFQMFFPNTIIGRYIDIYNKIFPTKKHNFYVNL